MKNNDFITHYVKIVYRHRAFIMVLLMDIEQKIDCLIKVLYSDRVSNFKVYINIMFSKKLNSSLEIQNYDKCSKNRSMSIRVSKNTDFR